MLESMIIPVTSFAQNAALVWCSQSKEAACIDPGGEAPRLMAIAEKKELNLKQVWLTHGHIDHVGGALAFKQRYPRIELIGPQKEDQWWLERLPMQSQWFGFSPAALAFEPDRWLQHQDLLYIGQETLEVRHCPGHTPGHVVFYSSSAKQVFVGDVLFAGSIGRTDFPQGDHEQLLESIRTHLWSLPDDTRVMPGHGPETSIGRERQTNPYL